MSLSAGSTSARASSGSRSSIRSIEPLMSANSAVTILRSPSAAPVLSTTRRSAATAAGGGAGLTGGVEDNGAAHSPQNFAAGGLANPQLAHRRGNGAAHSLQNFTPS